EREETAQAVHAALGRLSGREREVVLLRYFEQLSLRQVGDVLGVSEDGAKQRVTRAVRKLGMIMGSTRYAPASGVSSAALAAGMPMWLEAPAHARDPEWL